MATYQVIAWRDIPAVVEARDGAGAVTRQLSERFQSLIDSVAMQFGLEGSEAYIEQWTRSAVAERAGTAAEVADAVAAELEDRFQEFIGQAFRRP
ncbi:MAG TPA: virulence factor [Methylomirabilota bacterium]|nr:virulence factor [Methylomirabilota bacterium]